MFPLILTVIATSGCALILKYNDTRKGSAILLLCGNYLAASLIGFIFLVTGKGNTFSTDTILFGAFLGLMFVGTFFAFSKAVGIAGTALSTVSSRLSVLIPVLFSIILFNEIPRPAYYAGFVLTSVTILLFYLSLRKMGGKKLLISDYLWLFYLFAGIGFNDFSMKIFESNWPESEKHLFLFSIFFFAFLYTLGIVLAGKVRFDKHTAATGLVLGIPNIFSSFFLLLALKDIRAIVVYPVTNISVILLTAFAAWVFWKEKPDAYGIWSIITGLGAIILLGL